MLKILVKKRYILTAILILSTIIFGCTQPKESFSNQNDNLDLKPSELRQYILEKNRDFILIDVRTPKEYNKGHIPTALLIPYNEIESHTDEIPKEKLIVLYCKSGGRSGIAASRLKDLGYKKVINFGGIYRWTYELEK